MIKYQLSYQTRGDARCCWCWKLLPTSDAHTVIQVEGTTLRFHHGCWSTYRTLSGIEGHEARAFYKNWPVARIEALRLHAGLTLEELAGKLRVSKDRLVNHLGGQVQLGQKPLSRLRELAVATRFERQEENQVDWSDRRACFTLCMRQKWLCGDLASRLGVKDNTVSAWWDKGVPRTSVRYWGMLDRLAQEYHFDQGMLISDHLWTAEYLGEAVRASGQTQAAWAAAGDCHYAIIRDAIQGRRRINRQMAYYLTGAAIQFGIELPPEGQIERKRRPPRQFPDHETVSKAIWKQEELALLGTMPDKVVSERLGNRTVTAVRRMRRLLKIQRAASGGTRATEGSERDVYS